MLKHQNQSGAYALSTGEFGPAPTRINKQLFAGFHGKSLILPTATGENWKLFPNTCTHLSFP